MIQHWTAVGALLDQRVRRLAKYSRYNASEKGRARVAVYRARPYFHPTYGFRFGTVGSKNRETSQERLVDKRIAAGEQMMRDMLDAYNAKHGVAPGPRAVINFDREAVNAMGRRAIESVMGRFPTRVNAGAGPPP